MTLLSDNSIYISWYPHCFAILLRSSLNFKRKRAVRFLKVWNCITFIYRHLIHLKRIWFAGKSYKLMFAPRKWLMLCLLSFSTWFIIWFVFFKKVIRLNIYLYSSKEPSPFGFFEVEFRRIFYLLLFDSLWWIEWFYDSIFVQRN